MRILLTVVLSAVLLATGVLPSVPGNASARHVRLPVIDSGTAWWSIRPSVIAIASPGPQHTVHIDVGGSGGHINQHIPRGKSPSDAWFFGRITWRSWTQTNARGHGRMWTNFRECGGCWHSQPVGIHAFGVTRHHGFGRMTLTVGAGRHRRILRYRDPGAYNTRVIASGWVRLKR